MQTYSKKCATYPTVWSSTILSEIPVPTALKPAVPNEKEREEEKDEEEEEDIC